MLKERACTSAGSFGFITTHLYSSQEIARDIVSYFS